MTRAPLLAVALREPAARLMSAFLHLGGLALLDRGSVLEPCCDDCFMC